MLCNECQLSSIIGQTHHMLVSCYGKQWKEVTLAMCSFTAYIDDSGTDPKQQAAIASALIIPAARIIPLQLEWDALKKKEGFTDFHMSEFSSPTPPSKSQFVGWNKGKHTRVYRRVRQITKKYGLQAISFSVYKKDYDEIVPQDMRKDVGQFHYTWAIRNVIGAIDKWKPFHKVDSPLEYIFDWEEPGSECRKQIEEVMAQAEHIASNSGLYSNFSFRKRHQFPGLQCVDTLGWISYQVALRAFCKKPLVPDARIGWEDFRRHRNPHWRVAGTIRRVDLERLVHDYRQNGVSRQFFEEWRASKS